MRLYIAPAPILGLAALINMLAACTNPNLNSPQATSAVTRNVEVPGLAAYSDQLHYMDRYIESVSPISMAGSNVVVVANVEPPAEESQQQRELADCDEASQAKWVVARADYLGSPYTAGDVGPGFFLGQAAVNAENPEDIARATAYQRAILSCQNIADQSGGGICRLSWITVMRLACGFRPYIAGVIVAEGGKNFYGEVLATTAESPNWSRAWWLAKVSCAMSGSNADRCEGRRSYYIR